MSETKANIAKEGRYEIRAVRQAFAILEMLSEAPFTLVEIAESLDLARNTVFRQASTFLASGWAALGVDGRYRLTAELGGIGMRALARQESDSCRSLLDRLADRTFCTSLIWLYEKPRMICLDGTRNGTALIVNVPRGYRIEPDEGWVERIEEWRTAMPDRSEKPILTRTVRGEPCLSDLLAPLGEDELEPDLFRFGDRTPALFMIGVRTLNQKAGGQNPTELGKILSEVLAEELSVTQLTSHQEYGLNSEQRANH